jgi:hypothetical protein
VKPAAAPTAATGCSLLSSERRDMSLLMVRASALPVGGRQGSAAPGNTRERGQRGALTERRARVCCAKREPMSRTKRAGCPGDIRALECECRPARERVA